ncbi:hypothetical protein N7490_001704 [Penicillium lividum]|nr:hypothetical protein N7490_001704 [Penicillium lividum]
MGVSIEKRPWGHEWRSSKKFILVAVATTILTDMFLHDFLVSILPSMLEDRVRLDPQLEQNATLALLAEGALISFLVSPVVHHHSHRLQNDNWLLGGLVSELLGSVIIAYADSLPLLLAGRFVQAVANTSVGILGLSSLSRKVPSDQLRKVYGIVNISLAVGTTCGPLIAGTLLQLAGYWRAWCCAFIASLFGIGVQCLMVDTPLHVHGRLMPTDECTEAANEESPLLTTRLAESSAKSQGLLLPRKSDIDLYVCLFTNGRYVGGIVSGLCCAVVLSSTSATLPLHVRRVLNCGSLSTGLLFAALHGPNVVLGVPVAWLKKRIGTRHPTSIGFAVLAIMLWLMGIQNRDLFMYVASVMGAGIAMSLLNGVGMMEATHAVYELQEEHPELFGSGKGYTRAVFVTHMSCILGAFLGPIVSGLSERIGYCAMNCVLGGFPMPPV